MPRLYLLTSILLFSLAALAQPAVKKISAQKTVTAPKIDGVLDDEVWKTAPVATDFVELNPVAGRHEKPEERTEVRILYDNTAIYVGARMYETAKEKVQHEFVNRDNVGNSDFIGLILDTYLDGLNGSGFYVTAAGVQFDAKYAPNPNGNNEDPSWNAVWESAVKIDDQG
ncbi:carbohydrate binding family 9 domain-containing protein [uncultured Mucilaginibacter sp.]|uniref:carbohydrate binding family 9 domain-containing protein n=1 Tax=uncultured Mucilaginibacter sp. TaxID=797541 RepID=UPI0025D54456|nr:carbohydrate binding family 9 domain-containing protein [uncultured Mucilaginibacter sp.]